MDVNPYQTPGTDATRDSYSFAAELCYFVLGIVGLYCATIVTMVGCIALYHAPQDGHGGMGLIFLGAGIHALLSSRRILRQSFSC